MEAFIIISLVALFVWSISLTNKSCKLDDKINKLDELYHKDDKEKPVTREEMTIILKSMNRKVYFYNFTKPSVYMCERSKEAPSIEEVKDLFESTGIQADQATEALNLILDHFGLSIEEVPETPSSKRVVKRKKNETV